MIRRNRLVRILAACLLGASTALFAGDRASWVEVRSPHFIAYSDAGEGEARAMLRRFEEIRTVFLQLFPKLRVDAPKPTLLLVTQDEASMKRFLPKSFEGKNPKKESGVFSTGSERNYALVRLDASAQFEKPFQVLFHEYTHGILHLNFQGLPTWLDEGLADFYGTTEILADRVLIGKVSNDTLGTLRRSVFLPLETLLTVDQESPHYRDGTKTGTFYSQSAMLVHYLLMDEQAQKDGVFGRYLAALDRHGDPLHAAREGLGDLAKIQGAAVAYSRRTAFRYWTYNVSAQLSDKDFRSRALEPAEALVLRAEFLQQLQQEPAGRPLLEAALRLNPNLPVVHAALGMAHLERGEHPQAISAFEQAIRLNSQDFRPYFHLARLQQRPHDAFDPKRVEQLEAGRLLRPDFPPIHSLLAQEYVKDPNRVAQALAEMKQAIQFDPGNLSYLADLGSVYTTLNKDEEAQAVLQRLKAQARTPREKAITEQFSEYLASRVEWRRAATARAAQDASRPNPPTAPSQSSPRSISFHLSSYLVPLGREVLLLAQEGKVAEAILKVEAAQKKSKYAFDKKKPAGLVGSVAGPAR